MSDTKIIEILSKVATATITTILLKKGLRNVWMRGARPLRPAQPRLAGRAFTLRFVPAREDLATPESWSSPKSTRAAIELMSEGCVAVADAMGVDDAGISATFCAQGWPGGVSLGSLPTPPYGIWPGCSGPACRYGVGARRLRRQ
jgi:regulator of RNase E activity RraA